MFEHQIRQKSHHTGKEGEQAFNQWKSEVGLNPSDFDFRVKTGKRDKRGFEVWMNVTSWGFYQGSDWRWYFFISYRSSDQKMTWAYHFDCDDQGMATGTPRHHVWSQ